MLDKAAILAAVDLPTEEIEVPEWGGTVRVRGLNTKEREDFEAAYYDDKGKRLPEKSFRAELVARCLVDETGVRLFTGQDVSGIAEKSAAAVSRIFPAAVRLSGLGDLEGLKGN